MTLLFVHPVTSTTAATRPSGVRTLIHQGYSQPFLITTTAHSTTIDKPLFIAIMKSVRRARGTCLFQGAFQSQCIIEPSLWNRKGRVPLGCCPTRAHHFRKVMLQLPPKCYKAIASESNAVSCPINRPQMNFRCVSPTLFSIKSVFIDKN